MPVTNKLVDVNSLIDERPSNGKLIDVSSLIQSVTPKKKVNGNVSTTQSKQSESETPSTSSGFDIKNQVPEWQPLQFKPNPTLNPYTAENNFGINPTQNAVNNISPTENTAVVEPKQTLKSQIDKLNQPTITAQKLQRNQEAIDNTVQKYLKSKGINAQKGSTIYNQTVKEAQFGLDNGLFHVAEDPATGQMGFKKNVGFWDSLKNGFNKSNEDSKVAAEWSGWSSQQKSDYIKNNPDKLPKYDPVFIGERPTGLGTVGQMIGENAPMLGKAALGYTLGSTLVAAGPETAGASLAGLPALSAFAFNTPDMVNQGVMNEEIRRFQILKHQNPNITDDDAWTQAQKGDIPAMVGAVINNAIMTYEGTPNLEKGLSNTTKGVVANAIDKVVNPSLKIATAAAGTTAALQEEGILQGIKTNQQDIFNQSLESFKQNGTQAFLLTGMFHVLPKFLQSVFKYGLTKDGNLQDIQTNLKANEGLGNIPPGTSDKIMADLDGYKQGLDKLPNGLDPQSEASVAGLIQKKNDLTNEMKTKDESFHPEYKKQIEAIQNQIQDIQRTGNPLQYEVDMTGIPLEKPVYDDVAQLRVEAAANKIAKGKPLETPQDIQASSLFADQLNEKLQSMMDEEKNSNADKENPNTEIQDNIKKYLSQQKPTQNEQINATGNEPMGGEQTGQGNGQEIRGGQPEGQANGQKTGQENLSTSKEENAIQTKIESNAGKGEASSVSSEGDKRSDADIENRMTELSKLHDDASNKEFDLLEKEMAKRERATVFNVPLSEAKEAIDALMKKEKEMPNGWGSFITKRDASESKSVIDDYSNPKDISDDQLKRDFKNALMGRPATWYADGLKLRESMKEAANRGIDINDMLKEIAKEFTKDGYDINTAKEMIAYYLKPVFEGSQKVETNKNRVIEPSINAAKGEASSVSSERVEPNQSFRTMEMGNDEGKDETPEARKQMKVRMSNGDIPMDGENGKGETGKQFANRILSAWNNVKDNEPENTTVVTHSSVLKAIKAYEDMKDKPSDPSNFTSEQWKEFSDNYNKESTENGDLETFKGKNGNIHVIRHGQTEDNENNKFRSGNTPLTEKGIKQAEQSGKELNNLTNGEVPKIISSDLPRAMHSSDIINSQLKTKENAIPESKTGEILQREQSPTGETGGERGRMEQSQQGNETPPPSQEKGETTGEEENDLTSIKNEIVNERRKQLGLKSSEKVMKKTFGETWKEAKNKLDEGYDPRDLVEELNRKPRPISDVEDAILLHEQNTRELELINANKKINEAFDKGDEQSINEWKVRRARILDNLQDIYNAGKKAGTATARGLSARQMIADRKYNLVNMLSEKRAANGGEKLSDSQVKIIEGLHQKIKDTQSAYDEYVKNAESEIKNLQEKILGKKINDKKSAAQQLRDWADKVEKSKFGKADIGEGTQIAGASFDINKAVAKGIRFLADGLEKGGEMLKLIKEYVDKLKNEFPDLDEIAFTKRMNKEVIESGIYGTYKKEVTDYSHLLKNPKAIKLEADAQRAKNEADYDIKKDELKKRPKFQKVLGGFVKTERAIKLSNPITLGKLTAAAISRYTTTPLEDIVGGIISPVLPKSLISGAVGERGGLRIKETVNAYKDGIIKGIMDSKDILSKKSHGKSDIDILFGKKGDLPPEALDFFGQLHSAIKAPVKRFAFEKGLQRRLTNYVKAGADISDPMVQTEAILGAYKDANRAIFMQDNKFADGWQHLVNYFEQVNPKTGKQRSAVTASTMQWLLPFVKVPTNIAAETGTHVYGVPVGVGKIVYNLFIDGLKDMSGDEKDAILRSLKKGSIGLAALTLGYMNPKVFGGYYQQYEKRKESDAKAAAIKVLGMNIPAWLLESPLLQTMQIGATVRRVKDGLTEGHPKGIYEGAYRAALGMAEKVPMIDQPQRIFNALGTNSPKERSYYFGELAKGTFDPAVIQKIAEWTDKAKKRYPTSILEHIESGLPGLRELVPNQKQSKGGSVNVGRKSYIRTLRMEHR